MRDLRFTGSPQEENKFGIRNPQSEIIGETYLFRLLVCNPAYSFNIFTKNQSALHMKLFTRTFYIALLLFAVSIPAFSQTTAADEGLPTDYLTNEFHAGRRDALRTMMPASSVAVIFAYPER